jgi:signal transduction histidine kinase
MHNLIHDGVLNALILGLLAAVAGFCLADFLTRRIARPLRELVAGTRAVSLGDLTWRASVSSRDEVGELAQAFGAMTRSLQSHIEELIRAERLALLGKLAAGIAHEVRNPLDAIKGAAQVIQTHATSDEKARKFTRIIQEEVTSLNRFLTQFLELARPVPLQLGPVAVSSVAQEVLALLGPRLSEGTVKVQADLPDDLPQVQAESHQIKQVVLNLCLNAIQAMPDGGTLTVSSRASSVDGQSGVELRVEDTGPGVSEEIRHQLFEPFVTTKADGSGLGLAVSRSVIERHRGRIWLAPEPERGTTFCVWLPEASDGAEAGAA